MSARLSMARAVGYHYKFLNLTAVKKIRFRFDPFTENVHSLRQFVHQLSVCKVRQTNHVCQLKIDIQSDGSKPVMEVQFNDRHKALFKTESLNNLEIIMQFNKMCRFAEAQQVK